MRLIILTAALVSMFGASAQALTLVCEMQNHGTSRYNASIVDSWVPRKQVHVLNLNKERALYKGPNLDGKINVENEKRIQWRYKKSLKDDLGKSYYLNFKFVFLRKQKILVTSVESARIRPIENVKGTCVEQ